MENETLISGPFGSYPPASSGGVLNSLCNEGVPLTTVENLTLNGDKTLSYNGKEFAKWKMFAGIDKPLFYFQNNSYSRQSAQWGEDNKLYPKFKLSMYVHGSASLVITKDREPDLFTEELYDFMKMFMGSNVSHITEDSPDWHKQNHKMYKLRQAACAFFQGGSSSFEDGWIYIEFHKPEGAQAFVDYINANFVYKNKVKPPEHSMFD